MIFKECVEGHGSKDIVKSLNIDGILAPKGKEWNPTTVYQILTNEVYIGTLVWGKKRKG